MRKTIFHTTTNTTAQTLVEPVARVNRVVLIDPGATSVTQYAVVTGTPTGTQVQFTGKPSNRSSTLTFPTAPAAGLELLVDADTWLPASQ